MDSRVPQWLRAWQEARGRLDTARNRHERAKAQAMIDAGELKNDIARRGYILQATEDEREAERAMLAEYEAIERQAWANIFAGNSAADAPDAIKLVSLPLEALR